MSRFLERQLKRAETKPLGRTENYYKYDEATGTGHLSQRRLDAGKNPPMVTQEMTPVGRTSGVCKPGSEADGERYTAPEYGADAAAMPRPSKKRKQP